MTDSRNGENGYDQGYRVALGNVADALEGSCSLDANSHPRGCRVS